MQVDNKLTSENCWLCLRSDLCQWVACQEIFGRNAVRLIHGFSQRIRQWPKHKIKPKNYVVVSKSIYKTLYICDKANNILKSSSEFSSELHIERRVSTLDDFWQNFATRTHDKTKQQCSKETEKQLENMFFRDIMDKLHTKDYRLTRTSAYTGIDLPDSNRDPFLLCSRNMRKKLAFHQNLLWTTAAD